MRIAQTIEINTSTVQRLWTGWGTLTYDSQTWSGVGDVLSVSELELSTGEPDRRLSLSLSMIPPAQRVQFIQDTGPLAVVIEWIYHSSGSWNPTGLKYAGRLSTPAMSRGQLTVEIETLRGDVDLSVKRLWSHEAQQERVAGDLGMEYMRALADEGVESGWPP